MNFERRKIARLSLACNIYEKKIILGGKCFARIFSEELTKIQNFFFM